MNVLNIVYATMLLMHLCVWKILILASSRFILKDKVKTANYSIATDSDIVKKGVPVKLSQIKGEQWITQALKGKSVKSFPRSKTSDEIDGASSKGLETVGGSVARGNSVCQWARSSVRFQK